MDTRGRGDGDRLRPRIGTPGAGAIESMACWPRHTARAFRLPRLGTWPNRQRAWEANPPSGPCLGIRHSFHAPRRTHAALRAGLGEHPAITAAQMGHRDPRMTLRVHTDIAGLSPRTRLGGVLGNDERAPGTISTSPRRRDTARAAEEWLPPISPATPRPRAVHSIAWLPLDYVRVCRARAPRLANRILPLTGRAEPACPGRPIGPTTRSGRPRARSHPRNRLRRRRSRR